MVFLSSTLPLCAGKKVGLGFGKKVWLAALLAPHHWGEPVGAPLSGEEAEEEPLAASSRPLPPLNFSFDGTSGPLRTLPKKRNPSPVAAVSNFPNFPLFSARQSRVCRKNKRRVVHVFLVSPRSEAQRATLGGDLAAGNAFTFTCTVSTRGQLPGESLRSVWLEMK